MSKVVLKLEFSDAARDSGLFAAMIADFQRNRETDSEGRDVEKTSFHPGDIYHFLVQHDPGLRITAVKSSWGSVQALGAVTRSHTGERGEDIQLAEAEDEVETSYIPNIGRVSARWYGNSPDIVNMHRSVMYRRGPLPAIGKIGYSADWHSYRLVPAALTLRDDEEWPVLIVAYLDLATT